MVFEWTKSQHKAKTLYVDGKYRGFLMGLGWAEGLEWCELNDLGWKDDLPLPGLTVEEARSVVEAMIMLEG
jgi:hypothetical protein